MIRVRFTDGPAGGTTYDYPQLSIPLANLFLIDYATGRTSSIYQRAAECPDADGRWPYRTAHLAQHYGDLAQGRS